MVSLDPYINETTRHADIILPPTSPLEHDHYDIAFHINSVRNTARMNEPVFDKPEGSLHDWEIFNELGRRFAEALGRESRDKAPPREVIDAGCRPVLTRNEACLWRSWRNTLPELTLAHCNSSCRGGYSPRTRPSIAPPRNHWRISSACGGNSRHPMALYGW